MAAVSSSVQAAPVAVSLGAFGPSTVIDFNSLADQLLVTSQYASQGVTVTDGALYTNNSSTVISVFGSQGVSNYLYAPMGAASEQITLTFADPIIRLGFDIFSNGSSLLASLGAGDLVYAVGNAASFVGIQDLDGFSEVTLSIPAELGALFRLDNLRFELADPGPGGTVSEPGALALAALALAAAGVVRRRRAD